MVSKTSTTKVRSIKYKGWWKGIMEMADKLHVKLKCPGKVDPTTNKPYTEGQFFNVYNILKLLYVALVILIFTLVSIKNIGISIQMGLLTNWLCKEMSTMRNIRRSEKQNDKENTKFMHFML